MNIFVLDTDPVKAAQYQHDKHVVKMVLESTQLLSTAHWLNGSANGIYKPTHTHHPSTIWAAASLQNYQWLARHAIALSKEYTKRYGKEHKCHSHILYLEKEPPAKIPNIGLTPFVIAIDRKKYGHCIVPNDPVASYRNYYREAKLGMSGWNKGTPQPSWI
jgi:hypothetical protein